MSQNQSNQQPKAISISKNDSDSSLKQEMRPEKQSKQNSLNQSINKEKQEQEEKQQHEGSQGPLEPQSGFQQHEGSQGPQGHQSELNDQKEGDKNKSEISLEEKQKQRLGMEKFLQNKYKLQILLQNLQWNQYQNFPYETRYTSTTTSVLDQIDMQVEKGMQKQQKKDTINEPKVQTKDSNNGIGQQKIIPSQNQAEQKSFATYVEQIQAKIHRQEGTSDNKMYDEFLDEIW